MPATRGAASRSCAVRRALPRISSAIPPALMARAKRLTDHIGRVLPHPADREDAGLNAELVALVEALVRGDRQRASRLITTLEAHMGTIGHPLPGR